MQDYLLECCVDSVESAIIAEQGGADRLELCSNLILGGTTPGIQLYHEVRKNTALPIRVLIRPRYGDFLYSYYEYEIIKNEIEMFRDSHADGIVIGCLQKSGTFHMNRMEELKNISGDMKITIHRAFDMVRNPMEALRQLIELGVDSILTSGQENSCLEGRKLLQELVWAADDKVNILAGAGIDANIIRQLLQETDVKHFHMSAKETHDSCMSYRRSNVSMGLPFFSEYQIQRACLTKVQDAKNVIIANGRKENVHEFF